MRVYTKWSKEESFLFKEHYVIDTKEDLIALFPNRTWTCLKSRAGMLKLHLSRAAYSGNLSKLLDNSFISCYWIGFLCADAYIGNNGIRLEVSEKDKDHLKLYSEYVNFDFNKIYSRTRNIFSGSHATHTILITHTEAVKRLKEKYKISNQKTKNPVDISSLNDIQKLCFFIGFIDGDGSISGKNYPILSLELDKSWLNILEQFEQLMKKLNFNDTCRALLYTRKDTNQTFCRWQTRSTKTIQQLKYFAVAVNLPIMKRKWDKII